VNYLAATCYILTGLLAVGVSRGDPMVRRGLAFLLSRQNPDGGFGETPDSYEDPALAGRGPSSVQLTGLVAFTLARAGRAEGLSPAVRYLLERQRRDGGWDDRACLGTIFPHLHYYYTDSFPLYFAMEALHACEPLLG
jgi:squalene-hopene/tetraprenyl-beta-curcumene cyclase